ncbi:MAG TPA: hypothetical protein VIY72_09470 [Acidimicrobiales bacterium]
MTNGTDAGLRIASAERQPLGAFPPAPGSLTGPPGPGAAQQWLTAAQRWLATAGAVVARLDADAAAATNPDAHSADLVLAVTLTQTVTERLRAVADALGQGDVAALGELCHGRRPVGPNLTGAAGGFNVAEAAGLLGAVLDRLAAAVAADAVVASGVAATLGALQTRIVQLGQVAATTGLDVDARGWERDLDDAIASQDPALIRSVVAEVARRVAMFEQAVAQVADDQQRARAAATAAAATRGRAADLRQEVLALAAEAAEKIADPPRLGIPDPDALGPVPVMPTANDPGGWAEVAVALEDHLLRANRVVAALELAEARYRSVLDGRDALRGLLGAYRDRQLRRTGSRDLDAAYRAAHDSVWTAPCDLDTARRLVDAYVTAVRATTPPTPPTTGPLAPGPDDPGPWEGTTTP